MSGLATYAPWCPASDVIQTSSAPRCRTWRTQRLSVKSGRHSRPVTGTARRPRPTVASRRSCREGRSLGTPCYPSVLCGAVAAASLLHRDYDSAVVWDERGGRVSRSFDKWKFVDKDIRAFFKLTTNWAARRYEEIWNESWSEVDVLPDFDDPHYFDSPGSFEDKVEGLWPDDYHWILNAAVIKEAVTAFEVYLEKSLDEVFGRKLRARVKRPPGRSPSWETLVRGHKLIGANVSIERVQHVRALRHILTHQRGELRTETMRARFAADYMLAENADTGEQIWERLCWREGAAQSRNSRCCS